MKMPLKKKEEKKKRKQGGNKRSVGKSRKKAANQAPGADPEVIFFQHLTSNSKIQFYLQENFELESRSPTPTPPVLEPEVPIVQPQSEDNKEEKRIDSEVKAESNDESVEEDKVAEEEVIKYIPRLLDAAGNVTPRSRDQNLEPSDWSVQNVTAFLEVLKNFNLNKDFTRFHILG